MNVARSNPYALYVHCDGAMDYDSKNSGGIGYEIVFPEEVALERITKSIGKYEGSNIERLELEAILQGMYELLRLFEEHGNDLRNVQTIIITTDRFSLNDQEKTSPYKIREWRKNKWYNYEGKAIKNRFLLDKIDKTRKKISDKTYCSVEIKYLRRKFNKVADKLAKEGKKRYLKKPDIVIHGLKLCKRKYDGLEVDYKLLEDKKKYLVRIFRKEPVLDQWEIWGELCDGEHLGKKIKVYSDRIMELRLHRHHGYYIRIKKKFSHHVSIFKTIKEKKINGNK
ncbi:hypothetical protein HQ571_02060 [Candidatus Kuenenbacteria bacterium]|nr:hypothetical protein [Candidatus Kuenenbacteria bacterium]